jgi:hypothetical protein
MTGEIWTIASFVVEAVFGVLLAVALVYIMVLKRRIRDLTSGEMVQHVNELSRSVEQLRGSLGQQLEEARSVSGRLSSLTDRAERWETELSECIDQLSRTVRRANNARERLEKLERRAAEGEPPADPADAAPVAPGHGRVNGRRHKAAGVAAAVDPGTVAAAAAAASRPAAGEPNRAGARGVRRLLDGAAPSERTG